MGADDHLVGVGSCQQSLHTQVLQSATVNVVAGQVGDSCL